MGQTIKIWEHDHDRVTEIVFGIGNDVPASIRIEENNLVIRDGDNDRAWIPCDQQANFFKALEKAKELGWFEKETNHEA